MSSVGTLCLVQGSLPPPHAAFSCEKITAASELSGTEAGDKQRRGGCDPRLAALWSKIKPGRCSRAAPAHGDGSFWEDAPFLPVEQSTLARGVKMRREEPSRFPHRAQDGFNSRNLESEDEGVLLLQL